MIGLHIMRPTSIVVAGGGTETASVRSDGGVDFANATSLSLNGVFTATYDNYMIVVRATNTLSYDILYRLRLSGADATGSNYTYQSLVANGTSVTGGRSTITNGVMGYAGSPKYGDTLYCYGPNLAQPTAFRNVSVSNASSAHIQDVAFTHSLSTSYDGITVYPAGGSITGMITVYGYAQ